MNVFMKLIQRLDEPPYHFRYANEQQTSPEAVYRGRDVVAVSTTKMTATIEKEASKKAKVKSTAASDSLLVSLVLVTCSCAVATASRWCSSLCCLVDESLSSPSITSSASSLSLSEGIYCGYQVV